MASPETSSPGDSDTEPIPVISVTAEPAAPAQNAVPDQPEAVAAPPERKLEGMSAEAKAAEAKAAKPEVAARGGGAAQAAACPLHSPDDLPGAADWPRPGKACSTADSAIRSYRVAGVLIATAAAGALVLGFAVFHHSGKNDAGGVPPGRAVPDG